MFFMARVVGTHQEAHSVDIVLMDDGRKFSGVSVLSSTAGGNVGRTDLPVPSVSDPKNPFDSVNTGIRDIFCLATFVSRDIPIVVGFLHPKASQCLFSANNFKVDRHASDVYSTIDEKGNIEVSHPSGTYIRIGETTDHVNLTGLDYNEKWAIANNTETLPGLCVRIANSSGIKSTILIDHDGNFAITTAGTLAVTSTGEATIKAPNLVIDATVHIKKAVTCDADVTASGISLVNHVHSGVQTGSGNTGKPA